MQLIVLADGSVGRTRIVKSLDPVPGGADDLARFAAASAVFAPATREGQPIDVLLNFETSFITR